MKFYATFTARSRYRFRYVIVEAETEAEAIASMTREFRGEWAHLTPNTHRIEVANLRHLDTLHGTPCAAVTRRGERHGGERRSDSIRGFFSGK